MKYDTSYYPYVKPKCMTDGTSICAPAKVLTTSSSTKGHETRKYATGVQLCLVLSKASSVWFPRQHGGRSSVLRDWGLPSFAARGSIQLVPPASKSPLVPIIAIQRARPRLYSEIPPSQGQTEIHTSLPTSRSTTAHERTEQPGEFEGTRGSAEIGTRARRQSQLEKTSVINSVIIPHHYQATCPRLSSPADVRAQRPRSAARQEITQVRKFQVCLPATLKGVRPSPLSVGERVEC